MEPRRPQTAPKKSPVLVSSSSAQTPQTRPSILLCFALQCMISGPVEHRHAFSRPQTTCPLSRAGSSGRHLTAVLVSHVVMGRFHSLRKFLVALALSLCTVLFLTLLASRIEQHFFRRRAELLLSQVQSLELRKTPWQDAQIQLQRWGPNRVMGDSCDAHICSFQVTLDEFVFAQFVQRNWFVKLDDYFRWRLKLSYNTGPFERMEYALLHAYVRLGGHPARVTAKILVRDGTVWGKDFSVWIESYGHPVGWS